MVVAEPEGSFSTGIGFQLILGFQLVSGRKVQSPHCPDIQHNENYDNPYEKEDAMQAQEFATVNVHDCSLPWIWF